MRNEKGQFIKGYKHSEDSLKKIVFGLIGRKVSSETKKKLSLSNKGKKHNLIHTEEWKKQNSIRHTGKINSPKTRKKMSIAKLGENNPNWKGGVSPINTLIRMSSEYKLWREAVLKRDNYTCIWCGKKQGWDKETKSQNIVHADHIKPFCDYPELRLAIDNGRTLCVECHKKTNTYGIRRKNN